MVRASFSLMMGPRAKGDLFWSNAQSQHNFIIYRMFRELGALKPEKQRMLWDREELRLIIWQPISNTSVAEVGYKCFTPPPRISEQEDAPERVYNLHHPILPRPISWSMAKLDHMWLLWHLNGHESHDFENPLFVLCTGRAMHAHRETHRETILTHWNAIHDGHLQRRAYSYATSHNPALFWTNLLVSKLTKEEVPSSTECQHSTRYASPTRLRVRTGAVFCTRACFGSLQYSKHHFWEQFPC